MIFHRRYLAEISASFKDISVLFMIFVGHTMIRNFCQLLQTELPGTVKVDVDVKLKVEVKWDVGIDME